MKGLEVGSCSWEMPGLTTKGSIAVDEDLMLGTTGPTGCRVVGFRVKA